ncbi:heparin lyase I family protein [Shimia aestuarii]|uniref:heparin lyase I family protein n=1 Tax=Shimia aestuarii TaxID=254406 RepID=UPI001FB366E4|nr:heparin lyase I family protein [Shimia aestuarii]
MKRVLASAAIITAMALPAIAADNGKSILGMTRIEKEVSANKRYGFTRIREHTRLGRRAQRFELRHGDCGGNKYWDDCTNDRQRVERKEDPKNRIQRVGQQVWYGWSFFLQSDFVDVGPANTTLGQMKMQGWRTPLWHFNMRDGKAMMWFGDEGGCTVGRVSRLRGKWIDVTIFADYSLSPKGPSFLMYLDGKQVCRRSRTMVTQRMLNESKGKLYLKYGVYNSYVSRWLDRRKTQAVSAKAFNDNHAVSTGGSKTSKSAASQPFNYEWGVELPTQVVFYDEMRFGGSREAVDVRMIEERGGKPVD